MRSGPGGLRLGFLLVLLAVPGRGESVLTLPVPGDRDLPKEGLALEIRIPPKMVPAPEPAIKERFQSRALEGYDRTPMKDVPRAAFVLETLRTLDKKGAVDRIFDKSIIQNEIKTMEIVSRVVARVYQKLDLIYQNGAMRKYNLVVTDLERFQRVMDLVRPGLLAANFAPEPAMKRLDEMIARLKEITGRGAIRITGVREKEDGSTVLELEVQRFDPHLSQY